MPYLKKIVLGICLVVLTIVFPISGIADEFKIIPSIAVRGEYNDNIFYTADNEEDDFITTISAGLELIERTERLDMGLSATVSPFFYYDFSDLDEVDQNYGGTLAYQVSPLIGVNADALYDVSNRRDRDIETTGEVLTSDVRKRQEYGLGFKYTPTEISAIALSGGYLQERWDDEDLERQDLDGYNADLNFTYNLSKWWSSTTGRLNFGFRQYKYELLNIKTSETSQYIGSIGVQHWFSETINLIVDLGADYTDSDFLNSLGVEENSTYSGVTGQAILGIRGEITRGSIRIGHAVRPGSGTGSTVRRYDVVFNLRRRLAEKAAISITTGYYKNEADPGDFSSREIDEDTYFVRPNIRWEFFENFTLEAGYHFVHNDDRISDIDTERNRVYMQMAYGLPLFE